MEAIIKCSDSLAHAVLIALCHDSDVEKQAREYLEKLRAAEASATRDQSKGVKRKADELEICGQCKKPFVEATNSSKACVWHDGMYSDALSHRYPLDLRLTSVA